MSQPPAFFEPIRRMAAQEWDELQRRPRLAGAWKQLFMQVHKPRHVLSELLQNADDAGAREASVRIENDTFLFEHDGKDFVEEDFASLCCFGYSNKQRLHTIGFRGIGFKSTFSLGDGVEVCTPTLSVRFYRRQYTVPCWAGTGIRADGKTGISVVITDEKRRQLVDNSLEEWRGNPLSLLFFRHIRRLRVGDAEIHWRTTGPGPVPDSYWMALGEDGGPAYLLLRSKTEAFPADALAEIQGERLLNDDEETNFPPSALEIVLGAPGRLFVVLPAGREVGLPFACNAPFVQPPDRAEIKDPETSPTNRWLLRRAGELAANAMVAWLNRSDTSDAERAGAYGLFPDLKREDKSLEGVCGTIVQKAFAECIGDQPFLLTADGRLVGSGQSVALPDEVLDVWPPQQAAAIFDERGRPAFSRHVDGADRKKLVNSGAVEEIDQKKVLGVLQTRRPPRPETWANLFHLWAYVAPEVTKHCTLFQPLALFIVPVEGKDVLYASSDVVRIGEKKLLQSQDDWQFLAKHLIVLHHAWPRFLADRSHASVERIDAAALESVNAVHAVLKKIGLEDSTDVSRVIDRVAAEFFSRGDVSITECVRFAHLAAKLGAAAGENFRYVTRDRNLRAPKDHVLFDADGSVRELVPEAKRESLLLHAEYTRVLSSCTREEWTKWATSDRSGLLPLPPLSGRRQWVNGRTSIEADLRNRGVRDQPWYQFRTDSFFVEDWDFDESYWVHWRLLAKSNGQIWETITERLVSHSDSFWSRARSAAAYQISTSGSTRRITDKPLLPSWILGLRGVPCLRDRRGVCQKPGDLLRRTPETESLIDLEAFVDSSLDREATRPLLDLLGVGSKPTGPDRLLDLLRALARSEKPASQEVDRCYSRLDQMLNTCPTEDFQRVKDAFCSERLILTDKGGWATVPSVFLSADEADVPDAAIIRGAVKDLTLWGKLGVAERPTADLAMQWLRNLPLGQKVSADDLRLVRALLGRHGLRIWEECRAWINLTGQWCTRDGLTYALTMQSLVPWSHLHEWVKQKTADFQMLKAEITGAPPFSSLPTLAARVEDRLHRDPLLQGEPEERVWLKVIGSELCRIELDTESETTRVRSLAQRLAGTRWQRAPELEITPYIDGTPAGTPRRADVIWVDWIVFVNDLPKAKLAKRVPDEIAKAFGRPEIKAALDYGFERSPDDVRAYVQENFRLAPPDHPIESKATGVEPGPDVTCDGSEGGGARGPHAPTTVAPETAETGGAGGGTPLKPLGRPIDETDYETEPPAPGRPRIPRRPRGPIIMERFAAAQGFRKDCDSRFSKADGSWIAKTNGDGFGWERGTAAGEIIRYYCPKDLCLDRKALELGSDVWDLLIGSPALHSLILVTANDDPIEVPGSELQELKERGKLKLYPASYRLVLEGDEDA